MTKSYPAILKISRISPNLKPGKQPESIDLYRLINNLSTIDKIVQDYIKNELQSFLDENNIIQKFHHGSLKHHSTTTALACITNNLKSKYSNDYTTTTIQTDLSAAFDTIDHCILKTKLEHYGIRNDELSLISSFLENRYQYVSIDCFDSDIIKSNECSCIQGSKMAA